LRQVIHAHHGRPQKFFQGGQRQHFAYPCQVADDGMSDRGRSLSARPEMVLTMECQQPKRFTLSTRQRKCSMLRQQSQKMRFAGSHCQVYYV